MKKLLLCIFYFFVTGVINSQINDQVYLDELSTQVCVQDEPDGWSIPYFPVENDTIKWLVIFAKFPDDTWNPAPPNQSCQYWPGTSTSIPDWANDII